MNTKFIKLFRGLLTYWVVNLVIIGLLTIVCFAIAIALTMFISTGKLSFSMVRLIDIVQFVFIAAFLTGTVLWIKEEVFGNHD
jgi:hypothetical protein